MQYVNLVAYTHVILLHIVKIKQVNLKIMEPNIFNFATYNTQMNYI